MTSRMEGTKAIERIARWAAGLTLDAIPEDVRKVARTCLIDTLGVALAGTRAQVTALARDFSFSTAAAGDASVLGTRRCIAAPGAAFANAVSAHALDFDDNCYAGIVHGSAIIMPAALAAAEAADASGADFLTAFVAGSEAEYAVGAAVTPSLYDRGWWTTAVLGPIGACVAAARALGLGTDVIASALGLAIVGTGGAKASFGTDSKPLLAGRAAEMGVVSALLAARGAAGPLNALDHPSGFANLLNGGVFEAAEIDGLGTTWRLLDPGIDVKRIPLCLSSHTAVDATLELVAEHRIAISAIRRVICDVPPIVIANLAHIWPRSPQQAQFSMPFAIGASLLFGIIGLEHLTDAVIADPRLGALMSRVEMVSGVRWDEPAARAAAPEGAHVCIEHGDGQSVETFCPFPRGSAVRPLGPDEIDAKFRNCATYAAGSVSIGNLLHRLHAIEQMTKVRALFGVPHGPPHKILQER
jgi:2-methylcitrate dehydratase PrpD